MTAADPDGAAAQFELAVLGYRDEALRRFGIEADDPTARLVFAAVDGLILQQVIFGNAGQTEESLAVLRDLLGRPSPRRSGHR